MVKVWDILMFLKEVEAISQDYCLEGLQPLSSVVTDQRILCIDVQTIKENEKVEEKVEEVE